jgi:hypothetical protein
LLAVCQTKPSQTIEWLRVPSWNKQQRALRAVILLRFSGHP